MKKEIISFEDAQKEGITVKSTEDLFFQIESKKALEEAMLALTTPEMLYVVRRFGFESKPSTIEEVQSEYYQDYTLEELEAMEERILNKLRGEKTIKSLTP